MNNLLANLKHFVSHLILLFMLLSCIIVFIIKKERTSGCPLLSVIEKSFLLLFSLFHLCFQVSKNVEITE